MDRALRIHQALDRSPNYSFEQKLLAKQQLAKDFMAVGFMTVLKRFTSLWWMNQNLQKMHCNSFW